MYSFAFDVFLQLRHPHIVRLYDFFIARNEVVMIMELVNGKDVFDWVKANVGRTLCIILWIVLSS